MGEPRTSLLLVRHGQTTWNAAGRWQGHADPPLSPLGIEQAEALAAALAAEDAGRWSAVLASDLQRARHTAEIVAAGLGLPLELDARLRELDVGRWSGLTRAQVEALDAAGLRAFESGEPSVRPGGGECRLDIRRRARDCIRDLSKRRAGERLIVVTHLGVIRALLPGVRPGNAERFLAVAEEIAARPIDFVHALEDDAL